MPICKVKTRMSALITLPVILIKLLKKVIFKSQIPLKNLLSEIIFKSRNKLMHSLLNPFPQICRQRNRIIGVGPVQPFERQRIFSIKETCLSDIEFST